MYPNWLQVEYAITRLISFCTIPIVAANIAVNAPIIVITFRLVASCSYNGLNLIIKYTPAVTIVAAWINADTGVGPSIASGNQVCNNNWADFPTAPINNNIPITVNNGKLNPNITILFDVIVWTLANIVDICTLFIE